MYSICMCSDFLSDLFLQFKFYMFQTSSSSQARLEIPEPETKGATKTNPPQRSCSTWESLGLPPPRFPKRLACIEINSLSFDQGYHVKWFEGGIANRLMCCTMCQCLPRRPAKFDAWGHIFYERCIKHMS